MPPSTDAILPLAAQVSLTAETCAKRLAHSRFVMMITSSEADHRLVQVARRRHREAHVRAAAPHLRLVVHDDRPGAALEADLGHGLGLLAVLVVADDRDDVVLLDGHADVDDQRRVLQKLVGSAFGSPHSLVCELRQHVSREPLDLAELVERAEPADEVVHARLGERARASPRSDPGVPTGPQFERSIALDSSG